MNSYDWSAYGSKIRPGMVYDERTYAPGGQMLRRKLTDYGLWAGSPYGAYYAYKQRNPRPTKEVEILLYTAARIDDHHYLPV